MAELKNFGAIFTFAIGMETQLRDVYRADEDEDSAKAAEKRIEKLERARREYVVEITLEPIDGLEEDNYALDPDTQDRATMEGRAKQFYTDAAPKINVRQAQRILEKCGKQFS